MRFFAAFLTAGLASAESAATDINTLIESDEGLKLWDQTIRQLNQVITDIEEKHYLFKTDQCEANAEMFVRSSK